MQETDPINVIFKIQKYIKEDIENINSPSKFETTIKDYEINMTLVKSN